jgi:hypothetical protein
MPEPAIDPRVTVAFAMFCEGYDPSQPTDLRRMTTGIGGWRADDPPTIELTLALGLWNAGGRGSVRCRVGMRRPGEDTNYLGEGEAVFEGTAEMAIMPLKLTITCNLPGVYWAICEFAGRPIVEVPFSVSAAPAPAAGGAPA